MLTLAWIAQLVERSVEARKVGRSELPPGTSFGSSVDGTAPMKNQRVDGFESQ